MLGRFCSNPILKKFLRLNQFAFAESAKPPPIDPEEIERLRNQLQRKQNRDFDHITIQKRPTRLPMRDTEVKKPTDFYDPKTGPFRETQNVFNFNEPVLNRKPYELQVFGLGNGYFSVNDVWYPGSIITFPQQIFLWDVSNASEIRSHSLDILEVIKPRPIYVIIGTGKDKFELETSTYERFVKKGIKIEVLPTFEACSTFNVCVEDGKNVCAFLIPANL